MEIPLVIKIAVVFAVFGVLLLVIVIIKKQRGKKDKYAEPEVPETRSN